MLRDFLTPDTSCMREINEEDGCCMMVCRRINQFLRRFQQGAGHMSRVLQDLILEG